MSKKKEENKIGIIKIISIITTLLLILSSILLVYRIVKINLIPNKFIIIGSIVLVIINLIFLLVSLAKKKKVWKIINIVLSILFSIGFIFGVTTLKKSEKSLEVLFEDKEVSTTYYVLTSNESEYDNIDKLKNHNLGLMEINNKKVKDILKNYEFNYNVFTSIGELLYSLDIDNQGIIISKDVYEFVKDEDEKTAESLRKVYEFDITISKEEVKEEKMESTIDVKNSFLIYLSGVDASNTLSDVNILIAVNPDTHKILLVSTPRDYYVQIAGTSGLKEKLTHGGFYGINTQVKTMNQLFNVKIDSYVRVGYGSVVTVVDKIGGIDVYSDTAFRTSHTPHKNMKVGMNHLNGAEALAFAQERYAYASGDRHRGQNQEAVITAIIKKVQSNKNLLLKYDEILQALSPYVTTNVDLNDAQELVKNQIESLSTWNVESISVNGSNGQNYTASYPKQLTYVMIPDQSTVNNAHNKIMNVLRGA